MVSSDFYCYFETRISEKAFIHVSAFKDPYRIQKKLYILQIFSVKCYALYQK